MAEPVPAAEPTPPPSKWHDYWVAELVRAGMAEIDADLLTGAGCDLHAVREALRRGCDPKVAYAIFS